MYCYDKKGNEVKYQDAIKYKKLYNKALKVLEELRDYRTCNLMFQCEDEETKQHYYKAEDELKSFMDNLQLKEGYNIK